MFSSLLAALLFFAPISQNFDGLKLEVLDAPKEPVTQGPAKTWEGTHTNTQFGKEVVVLNYSLTVTDLKALPQKPTEDQVLLLHERNARTNMKLAAQNFRRSFGKIGDHKLLLLSGTVMAPVGGGGATNSHWLSFAFTAGDKAYQYSQVSLYENNHTPALGFVAGMTLTEEGKELKVTGTPTDLKGDYTIGGIPFVLTTPDTPYVQPGQANEPLFGAQYTALMVHISTPSYWYKVREVKPEDKRTDSQLFRDLVQPTIPAGSIPEEQFAVKDGSGTVEAKYQDKGKEYVAYLRFERAGKWVAVLIGYSPTGKDFGLKNTNLSRDKTTE